MSMISPADKLIPASTRSSAQSKPFTLGDLAQLGQPEELDIALTAKPDYVALGPVYETKLKIMKWAPQGLERVGVWKKRIGALPLVAIAGITLARADGVLDAGADSCAVVTDFLTASDPDARVKAWLAWAERRRG